MVNIGSLAPRLVVVALLALGLVGMHHLVVVACHHAAGHSSQAAPLIAHGSHGDHSSGVAPSQAPREAPDGAPGGLVGAAATCLAILLMIVGLVLPQVLARVRRWRLPRSELLMPRVTAGLLKPPDLIILSVSRT